MGTVRIKLRIKKLCLIRSFLDVKKGGSSVKAFKNCGFLIVVFFRAARIARQACLCFYVLFTDLTATPFLSIQGFRLATK